MEDKLLTFDEEQEYQIIAIAERYDDLSDQLQNERVEALEKAYSHALSAGAKIERSFIDELLKPY